MTAGGIGKRLGRLGIGLTLLLFLLGGLAFAVGKQAVDHTNTLAFCISCHEMRDNNYAEYKDTIHARNRSGVKAVCADCHVPHDGVALALRKLQASNDVLQHLLGTIDTPQKFEAHRLEMAKQVWRTMKQTDSRECRHCHDVNAMDPELQGKTAQKQHQKLADGQHTCIDCHFGIAHREPAGGVEPRDVVAN
jgi:cytochrome c-type protein NapC